MNTLEELAIKYGTDKKIASGGHGYTAHYSKYFDSLRNDTLNVFELGVREGWSLRMWHEYFANSKIFGIDNNLEGLCPKAFEEPRIDFRPGSQDDEEFLSKIAQEADGFDIVIDDCSHISDLTIASFEILWKFIKPGGIYVIEDLHVCDYAPVYWHSGPNALQYIAQLNNANLNIEKVELFDGKICFIRKNKNMVQNN